MQILAAIVIRTRKRHGIAHFLHVVATHSRVTLHPVPSQIVDRHANKKQGNKSDRILHRKILAKDLHIYPIEQFPTSH